MTKPRYQLGCSARSKACGLADASDPEVNAWNLNLNNGNSNLNNQNNKGLPLAVRGPVSVPGEYQGAGLFEALWQAWQQARRQKCSHNQLAWEAHALDNLLDLERSILAGNWSSGPSLCFIAEQPKVREIHAPEFGDRVVHHYAIPILEAVYEPFFIYDSYANRVGKGTHAAVRRLTGFVHQVHSGQGHGFYLQLDIRNFFYSINRELLYAMLKASMVKAAVPLIVQHIVHALLRRSPLHAGVRYRMTMAERSRIPAHKRLENAAPGCGLTIGNLSSQFFANVYLNELDQFVKHVLHARRYLRYADDFILVHESREQLAHWKSEIERFLRERLRLELKPEVKLQSLDAGIDFLGYVVYPTHTRVRRRVVSHARAALSSLGAGDGDASSKALLAIEPVWRSYQGHFGHANSWRLQQGFLRQFPALAQLDGFAGETA